MKENCLNYALKILARRECSEQMLKSKLIQKEYPTKEVEDTLSLCREKGYVNNKRFTASYIRSTLRTRHVGPFKLLQYLASKGISQELFWQVWKELNIDERDIAEKALEKKLRTLSYKDEYEKQVKLQKCLGSKGFRREILKSLLDYENDRDNTFVSYDDVFAK